jgi:ankyrin repeat protein
LSQNGFGVTGDGSTPLHCAARCGDALLAARLLKLCSPSGSTTPAKALIIDAVDVNGSTALHVAAGSGVGGSEIVKTLIRKGRANAKIGDAGGDTVLHLAVRGGDDDVVGFLCSKKDTEGGLVVDVDAANANGDTAAHVAYRTYRGAAVDKMTAPLVAAGGDMTIMNKKGLTAPQVRLNTRMHVAPITCTLCRCLRSLWRHDDCEQEGSDRSAGKVSITHVVPITHFPLVLFITLPCLPN